MGGSDSGGVSSGGGGGGRGGPQVDCAHLVVECSVASPVPTTVATLDIGDVCDVELWSDPARIVVLTRPDRDLVGAITDRWQELVNCLDRGFVFEAEILQVTPYLRAEVRPVS